MTFMGLIHKQVKQRMDNRDAVTVNITAHDTHAKAVLIGKTSTDIIQYSDGMIYHRTERGGYTVATKTYQGNLTY